MRSRSDDTTIVLAKEPECMDASIMYYSFNFSYRILILVYIYTYALTSAYNSFIFINQLCILLLSFSVQSLIFSQGSPVIPRH